MCRRLKSLAEDHLKMPMPDLARELGYANTTVLARAWKGETFPDTEKLAKLANIQAANGLMPNIHWLITGVGTPLLRTPQAKNNVRNQLSSLVDALPEEKATSLLCLLVS